MSEAPVVQYVDNHVLALAKPAGMPCVPDASGDQSLLDWGKAMIAQEFQKPGAVFLGVVHRLDRPVSGVVVFGRTSKGASRLSQSFRDHSTRKCYWAVLAGSPPERRGEVKHFLRKDKIKNRVSVVSESTAQSKLAHTEYRVLEVRAGRSLVELLPLTGRAHQLRVAMASLDCPIVGDLRYGAREPLPDKSIALHALSLDVPHPTRSKGLELRAPLPGLDVWRWTQKAADRSPADAPPADPLGDDLDAS